MLKELRDALAARRFQVYFETYKRLLPKVFLGAQSVARDSLEYRIYIRLLDNYVHALRKIESRDPDFYKTLQVLRLRKILVVANRTRWWRAYFIKNHVRTNKIHSLDDLHHVPPVTRLDVADVPKEDILTCPTTNPFLLWRASSGSTTGVPIVWGLDKTITVVNGLAHMIKNLEDGGFSLGERGVSAFNLHFNLPFSSEVTMFKWFSETDFRVQKEDFDFDTKIKQLHNLLATKKLLVTTNPNDLGFITEVFKEKGLRVPVPFFLTIGSALSEAARKPTMEYFGAPVLSWYGAQEIGPCGFECRNNPGLYHPFYDRIILELLDENGLPVEKGREGFITITCLDNELMPLIRYRIGDIGVFHSTERCICGNPAPLFEIVGRASEIIKFSNGEEKPARYALRQFNVEPFVSKVRRFQIQQLAPDKISILLEIRESLPERAIGSLKQNLANIYGERMEVTITQVESILQTGPKFKVFVPLTSG